MPINTSRSTVGTGVYDPRGFYETPYGLCKAAVRLISNELINRLDQGSSLRILDAGAGKGRWGKVIRNMHDDNNLQITGLDKYFPGDAEHPDQLSYNNWYHADFLEDFTLGLPLKWDCIVMNPPFKQAEPFVRRAYDLLEDYGQLIALLPLNFAAGQARGDYLWRELLPYSSRVLAKRPNFGGPSAPKYEYCIYIWHKNVEPSLFVRTYFGYHWELDPILDKKPKRGHK